MSVLRNDGIKLKAGHDQLSSGDAPQGGSNRLVIIEVEGIKSIIVTVSIVKYTAKYASQVVAMLTQQ